MHARVRNRYAPPPLVCRLRKEDYIFQIKIPFE